MENLKELELTKDPLTNISIMVPMLNDRAREAVSYFMYGCFVGESIAKDKQSQKTQSILGVTGKKRNKN